MTTPAEPPPPNTSGTPTTPPRTGATRTRFVLGVLAGVAGSVAASAVAFAVYDATHQEPATFSITGRMELTGSVTSSSAAGFDCVGDRGYSDIGAATAVTVSDEAGTLLAKGNFTGSTRSAGTCTFTFTVDDVPRGKRFYEVEVGHRGGLSYTESEVESGLSLSLGN